MRRRGDLVVAVGLALGAHAGVIACAAWCMQSRALVPEFASGESSVRLTLVATPPAVPDPPPAAVRPPPPEPLPELPPESVMLPLPKPEEDPVEEDAMVTASSPLEVASPETTKDVDGDLRQKGVEDRAVDLSGVRPVYPMGSRLRGEEGLVQLRVRVDASGRAAKVEVVASSGHDALDRAAVRAASRAHYTTANGQTRADEIVLPIRFRLTD